MAASSVIPEGSGAGIMVWDAAPGRRFDPEFGYKRHLKFELHETRAWHLVRMASRARNRSLAPVQSDDEAARPAGAPDILAEMPRSAATGRDIEEIAREQDRVWSSKRGGEVKQKKQRRKAAVDPAKLPKAKADALPRFVEPSLPSAVDKAPSGGDCPRDQMTAIASRSASENGKVALLTRTGLD
jgi:bifunctional non-homologous end joining protein LigD